MIFLFLALVISAHADPKSSVLANGVQVLEFPSLERPLVELRVLIGSGDANDGKTTPGASQVLGRLMDQSPLWNDFQHSVQIDDDSMLLNLTARRADAKRLLDATLSVLETFAYSEAQVQEEQKIFRERRKLWLENRAGQGTLAVQTLIAKGTTYGRVDHNRLNQVKTFSAEQLKNFFNQSFRKAPVIVAVGTDFSGAALQSFAGLSARRKLEDARASFEFKHNHQVPPIWYIKQTGGDQILIRGGLRVPTLDHPVSQALRLANVILGESTLSVYNQRVRDSVGLNYGIQTTLNYARGFGQWTVETSTRLEWADRVIDLLENPVADADQEKFDWATQYLVGDNTVQASSFADRLTRMIYLTYLGYRGDDQKPTIIQVQQAMKILRPSVWVVVGDIDQVKWSPSNHARLKPLK